MFESFEYLLRYLGFSLGDHAGSLTHERLSEVSKGVLVRCKVVSSCVFVGVCRVLACTQDIGWPKVHL